MEAEKYYTPNLREFFLDFEYEKRSFNSDKWVWFKKEFTTDKDWIELDEEIDDGEIRVKFLDSEDLESLGWKPQMVLNTFFNEICEGFVKGNSILFFHEGKYCIYFQYVYDFTTENWEEQTMFFGTIKNKWELRKIMSQLGIE